MRRGDDVTLARALAEALDGRAEPTGELQAIVRVLEAAAAEARFDVAAAETERALAAARPRPRSRTRRRWPVPVAVAAAAAVALAVVLVLVSPFGSSPVVDVQAQALAALGGPGVVLEVSERIVPGPAGGFAASTRTGWIDPARGRAAWTQRTAAGTVVDQTLVERGRITRYDPATATAVVARTCAALATGCAAAVDPVAVYRQALLRASATSARPVMFAGRSAYSFALPVVRLADAARIAQVVTVDARSLLPERIEWRLRGTDGRARTVAVIDVEHVTAVPRDFAPQDAFTLPLAPGTAVTQLAAPGRPVRLVSTRTLNLAQARALRPRIDWLGPRFRGHRLGRDHPLPLQRRRRGAAALRPAARVELRAGRAAAPDLAPAGADQAGPDRLAHGADVRDGGRRLRRRDRPPRRHRRRDRLGRAERIRLPGRVAAAGAGYGRSRLRSPNSCQR